MLLDSLVCSSSNHYNVENINIFQVKKEMFKSLLNELFTLLLLTLTRTKFRDFRLLGKKAKTDTHENLYLYIFFFYWNRRN